MGESPTLPTILFLIPPVEVAQATLPAESTATAPTVSWALQGTTETCTTQFWGFRITIKTCLSVSASVQNEFRAVPTTLSWNSPSLLPRSSCVSPTLPSRLPSPTCQWGRWSCRCSLQTGWRLRWSTANVASGIFSGIKCLFWSTGESALLTRRHLFHHRPCQRDWIGDVLHWRHSTAAKRESIHDDSIQFHISISIQYGSVALNSMSKMKPIRLWFTADAACRWKSIKQWENQNHWDF